ncbi:MAG TPA: FAD-dependent oxidoreductase [Tepidisphaeraceae bacterium]|jgi:tryptophan halogenase|nr:FAD-dependent oxidoreductase [Tepidisphaeraceae bacterium]
MNVTPAIPPVKNVLVLGGGSAGFLAAITLKIKLPELNVTVLRSKELGIIGVGEGTTTTVSYHLHDFLKLPIKSFYEIAQPLWKLGIRFIWGTRPYFNFIFGLEMDARHQGMRKGAGHYCGDGPFDYVGYPSSLMAENKVFYRLPGGPRIAAEELAMHIENEKFVAWLEGEALSRGVRIMDDTVVEVQQDDRGISGLKLASGGNATADLFVDSSGFYSLLLGKTLAEPFISFKNALFCDRAVVGGWDRSDEPIKPYTTAEAMECGWCWQIEHEHRIIRGYVYSSFFISDEEAERELRTKNPRITKTRIVKFVTGCYQRGWVKNVVGIGNAFGFVEPLEATSLGTICLQSATLAETLRTCGCAAPQSMIDYYNGRGRRMWDSTRDFLAVHYKFNKRFDNPFWRECREKTDLGAAQEIVDYFQDNGPSGLWRVPLFEGTEYRNFGMEGYFAMLVGMQVPYRKTFEPDSRERELWRQLKTNLKAEAQRAYSIREALDLVRSPQWQWPADMYARPQGIGMRR